MRLERVVRAHNRSFTIAHRHANDAGQLIITIIAVCNIHLFRVFRATRLTDGNVEHASGSTEAFAFAHVCCCATRSSNFSDLVAKWPQQGAAEPYRLLEQKRITRVQHSGNSLNALTTHATRRNHGFVRRGILVV